MGLSNREIRLIQEALDLLYEAPKREEKKETKSQAANTRSGAVGEYKIAAYCAGASAITDAASLKSAKGKISSMEGAGQVFNNATGAKTNMGAEGSKKGGFFFFESGTTDKQSSEAGYTAAKHEEKIDGIEDDAQNVAFLIRCWYHDVKKNPKAIPVKAMKLDVTAANSDDPSQGDLFVTKGGKEWAWSLKVQGSEAGQQNLGSSELETDLKYDYKAKMAESLSDYFKKKVKGCKGIAPGCQVKKGIKSGSKKANYLMNKDKKITHIHYDFWSDNNLTKVVGDALTEGLVNNCLSVDGIKLMKDAIVANSGIGTDKGAETLIGSPKAAASFRKDGKTISTDDLFPGLYNIVTNNTAISKNKILIYAKGNTIHVGYGSTKDCDKKTSGRLWRMSLRRSGISGGATAKVKFDVKPPSLKGKHTYKTTEAFLKDLLGESYKKLASLLFEETGWKEFDLDADATEDPMPDDGVNIEDPIAMFKAFDERGGKDIDDVIDYRPDQKMEITPELMQQICAVEENQCDINDVPAGDESYEADESHHEADEAIMENRWLKLAGLL